MNILSIRNRIEALHANKTDNNRITAIYTLIVSPGQAKLAEKFYRGGPLGDMRILKHTIGSPGLVEISEEEYRADCRTAPDLPR